MWRVDRKGWKLVLFFCFFLVPGVYTSRSPLVSMRMAPATMAGPTKGKEGCLGTVGEAWARRLDGCVVGRRPPHRRR